MNSMAEKMNAINKVSAACSVVEFERYYREMLELAIRGIRFAEYSIVSLMLDNADVFTMSSLEDHSVYRKNGFYPYENLPSILTVEHNLKHFRKNVYIELKRLSEARDDISNIGFNIQYARNDDLILENTVQLIKDLIDYNNIKEIHG